MIDDPAAQGPAPSIAIVGVACRFPDADDALTLLDMTLAGRRAFRRLPPARLDHAERREADPADPGLAVPPRAALIEGWQFDRNAYGISESAYRAADPAQWLALETAARALADAGLAGGQGVRRDRAGVIIGNTLAGEVSRAAALLPRWPYIRKVLSAALASGAVPAGQRGEVLEHAAAAFGAPFPGLVAETLAGSRAGAIADRICGHFGFRGGGYAVDGGHSSALLALAAACTSLSAGDLDFVLAGGVDISLDPFELGGLARTGVLATGDMRVYDVSPTGFVPGEGCGLIALMRAADAYAAGTPVYAEIAGWGVSSAGLPGAAGPDSGSQLLALRRAYQHAGVDPADIQLIEGDGAGTAAGDLAELTALVTVRDGAPSAAALGSVKANIGHAKAAAGAAGLIKTALAVSAGVIPPATGCARPHPLLRGEDATLRVPRTAEPWPDGTRLAAVSAMDSGGSNVHIVLRRDTARRSAAERQRAPLPVRGEGAGSWTVTPSPRAETYVFGGSSRAAVSVTLARVAALAPWMSDGELTDLACQLGRPARGDEPVRVAVVASSQLELARLAGEAAALLPGLARGPLTVRPGIFASDGARGRIVLLFPGEEAPAAGCAEYAGARHGSAHGEARRAADSWAGTAASQPAIVQAALVALHWLDRLGVQADAAVGHGLGEITGLVWAGSLSEPDAARLVAQRDAVLSHPDPQRSGMVCVAADVTAAQAFCADGDLVIAAYNGPRCHVLAGPAAAVRELIRRAARDGVAVRVLAAPHGLHSPAMADRIAPLRSVLKEFEFGRPSRQLISTITGREVSASDDIAALLGAQITSPVRFAEALGAAADGADLLVETGPGQTLAALAAGCCHVPAVSLATGRWDDEVSARAAAALFAAGAIASVQPLLTGRPARPIDIWRERVFISDPCEAVPRTGLPEPAATTKARAANPSSRPEGGTRSGTPGGAAPGAAGHAAPGTPGYAGIMGAAAGGRPDAGGAVDSLPGVAPWARCFTETLRPPLRPVPAVGEEPWRLRATSRQPFGRMAAEVFDNDPAARGVLAVIGDPVDPDACAILAQAAREAVTGGQLVVITPGCGLAGFCASLHAEHPGLGITVLRTAETADGLLAAQRFAATEPGQLRELVLDAAGAPLEPVITPTEPASVDLFPLGPSDVVLVSGAAGAAAAALLTGCGAALAVLGPADPGEATAMADWLARLRETGARVGYEQADIADPDQAEAAVASLEQRFGPVTAVIHATAAGPAPMSADISGEDLHAQVSRQADGLTNVLGAVSAAMLRLLVTFGPVSARYGAAGQGAGSLASTALAEQARRLGPGLPGCRILHVDWSGDVTPIPVQEASRLLLSLLASADAPARVAIHGRVGVPAPPAPLMRAPQQVTRGRFVQEAGLHYPAVEFIADTRLSLPTDPYLADHRIDGLPVLPAVMGLEAMAQAASVLAGQFLRHATNVSMDAPVVIPPGPSGEQAVIRVCALHRGDSVEVVLRCDTDGFRVDHFRALFPLPGTARSAASPPADAASPEFRGGTVNGVPVPGLTHDGTAPAGIVDGTDLYGPICFQSGRFRRIAFLPEVTSRACRALVRGGDDQPWFGAVAGPVDAPLILGSPGLNDATLQVLQACRPHRRLLPAGCDAVIVTGQEVRGTVQVLASRPPGGTSWDVTAVDATGQAIVAWTGLRLREVGPLAQETAWHPSLLAVSLEGRATELGLDPALQVVIQRAEPSAAPADRDAAAVRSSARAPWLDAAAGSGLLNGFDLTVRATRPVACQWTTTRPLPVDAGPPITWPSGPDGRAGPDLAGLSEQVRAKSGESRAAVAGRLAVVAACLSAAGWRPETPLLLDDAYEGAWMQIRAGQVTVACTIANMSGVPQPVAVAVATWPAPYRAELRPTAAGEGAHVTPVAANGSGSSSGSANGSGSSSGSA
jgi:enediyne polyketide synthase